MRSRWWRVAQVAFLAAVVWFAARYFARDWAQVRDLRAMLAPNWWFVAGSGALVLLSYAVLVLTWQRTVRSWGSAIALRDAARIWFVSNLGRYIPGKVWQIGAMGMLAQRAGVSLAAAVGSSLVIALVNIVAGFVVVAATGARLVHIPGASAILIGGVVVATAVTPAMLPRLVALASRVTGRSFDVPRLSLPALWNAMLGCVFAWLFYGVGFWLLAFGIMGHAAGNGMGYIAVFTLSYLIGFLTLFSPGGLGTREVAMAVLLERAGLAAGAEAMVLVVASRVWLTVLEIVPGLLYLAARTRPGEGSTSSQSNGPHPNVPRDG